MPIRVYLSLSPIYIPIPINIGILSILIPKVRCHCTYLFIPLVRCVGGVGDPILHRILENIVFH